jgi:hypothetical protein
VSKFNQESGTGAHPRTLIITALRIPILNFITWHQVSVYTSYLSNTVKGAEGSSESVLDGPNELQKHLDDNQRMKQVKTWGNPIYTIEICS